MGRTDGPEGTENNEIPDIPAITTEQMIDVDRAMVDDYGIDLTRMMENAGRALASLARTRFLDGDPSGGMGGKRVAVLAGSGGNGGGGRACARKLSAWGASVEVHLSKPAGEITGVPAEQLVILNHMGVPVHEPAPEPTGPPDRTGADLVIDALFGYRLQGAPRGHAAILIGAPNQSGAPVLSLDVPSGVHATTGDTPGLAVIAHATMTLALPKTGLSAAGAVPLVGELYLADIGVPPALYA